MIFLSWLITLLKAYLGIKSDIAQRQAEHVGAVIQQNTDLRQEIVNATEAENIKAANSTLTDGQLAQWVQEQSTLH